jgi:hypothetical protein
MPSGNWVPACASLSPLNFPGVPQGRGKMGDGQEAVIGVELGPSPLIESFTIY